MNTRLWKSLGGLIGLVILLVGFIVYTNLTSIDRRAQVLFAQGDYHQVISLYETNLEQNPRDPRNHQIVALYSKALMEVEDYRSLKAFLNQQETFREFLHEVEAVISWEFAEGNWLSAMSWYNKLFKDNLPVDEDAYLELIYYVSTYRGDARVAQELNTAVERYSHHPLSRIIQVQIGFSNSQMGLTELFYPTPEEAVESLIQLQDIELEGASPRIKQLVEDYLLTLAVRASNKFDVDPALLGEVSLYTRWLIRPQELEALFPGHPLLTAGKALGLYRNDVEAATILAGQVPELGLDAVLSYQGWQPQELFRISHQGNIRNVLWSPTGKEFVISYSTSTRENQLELVDLQGNIKELPKGVSVAWNPSGTALAITSTYLSGEVTIHYVGEEYGVSSITGFFYGWASDEEIVITQPEEVVYNIKTQEVKEWSGPSLTNLNPAHVRHWRTQATTTSLDNQSHVANFKTVYMDFVEERIQYAGGIYFYDGFWSPDGRLLGVQHMHTWDTMIYNTTTNTWTGFPSAGTLIGWYNDKLLFFTRVPGSTSDGMTNLYFSVDPESYQHQFHYVGQRQMLFPCPNNNHLMEISSSPNSVQLRVMQLD